MKTLMKQFDMQPQSQSQEKTGQPEQQEPESDGDYQDELSKNMKEIEDEEREYSGKSTNLQSQMENLSIEEKAIKHPEKKAKAAYQKFIEDRTPELKKEYPNLKRSQLLTVIYKEWKKSPQNPFNQKIIEYNEKQ